MGRFLVLIAFSLTTTVIVRTSSASISARPGLPMSIETRINDLIGQMSLEEKVLLIGGNDFDTFEIPRLGIPAIKMTDGPLGVRLGKSTAFPSGIAMGASFNPELAREIGVAIADEARVKGRNMLLGPCVNISRNPFGGRNFESYGEDPFLNGSLAAAYVEGIQSRNVLASVKHFAANDQEFERMTIDVRIGMRALFEIHLPAFKRAIDAGSWTVMSAYNKINGHHASENDFLQNKVLKETWNFQGLVVSDWGATHSTIPAALGGLDLEMPFGEHFNSTLIDAVKNGQVPEATIDDKVRRILRAMFAIGLIDSGLVPPVSPALGPESKEHQDLALRASKESIVLLKNEDRTLPLRKSIKSVAVLGPNAEILRVGGGGSSQVEPYRTQTPLEALRARLGDGIKFRVVKGVDLPGDVFNSLSAKYLRPHENSKKHGLKAEYFANTSLAGEPILTQLESKVSFWSGDQVDPRLKDHMSIRYSGFVYAPKNGKYTFSTSSDDGVRLEIDDRRLVDNWTDHGSMVDEKSVKLSKGWHKILIEYFNNASEGNLQLGWQPPREHDPIAQAARAAQRSDVAIVFAGLGNSIESEGVDRTEMDLPEGQAALINAVAKANPNTIVVLFSGNPIAMSEWLGNVKSLLQVWYPGQEGARAIADVLTGHANPSGKLPISFLKKWEDSPAYGNYPGQNGMVEYAEGIFVGYRHYDANNAEVEFPFGYGLSYTSFEMKNLKVIASQNAPFRARVELDVKNTGKRSGAEVVQVYVGENTPSLPRPVRELKAFQKVELQPGETKTVSLDLPPDSFSFFDDQTMSWRSNPGEFRIWVGPSSRQLPLEAAVSWQ